MLARLVIYLLINGVTLVILEQVAPSRVHYNDLWAVVIFAVVLTVLNAVVRPVLRLITLPLTCLTFGLFALVVNGVVFYLGAKLVPGITISFLGALIGAIIAAVLNGALTRALDSRS